MVRYFTLFLLIVTILNCGIIVTSSKLFAQEETNKVKKEVPKYIPEHERARLKEARDCLKEDPGNTWKECRNDCAEICNQIIEPYERGVCNGVLIQLCCNQYPSGCK